MCRRLRHNLHMIGWTIYPTKPAEGTAQAGVRTWIAASGRRVLGSLTLRIRGDHAHLETITVAQNMAGLGVRRSLMRCAERACRKAGLAKLSLRAPTAAPHTIRVYKDLGWQPIRSIDQVLHMSKRL